MLSYPDKFDTVNHGLHLYRLAVELGFEEHSAHSGTQPDSDWELLVDEDGLEEWISEYPEDLDLANIVDRREEGMFFFLRSCPFKGAPHRGHMPAIILHPHGNASAIGFNCFSSDCSDYTFGDCEGILRSRPATGQRRSCGARLAMMTAKI